jgi:hypothetical protein
VRGRLRDSALKTTTTHVKACVRDESKELRTVGFGIAVRIVFPWVGKGDRRRYCRLRPRPGRGLCFHPR